MLVSAYSKMGLKLMGHELEQFYAIFFEEASELLVDMETHLLELNIESPDLEELNAIFRAAHSIKGGAGAFGFTDMTETTHMLESLLDKLRKGEMAVNSQMIDVFLQSGDLLKRQLGGHRGDEGVNTNDVDGVVSKLKEFMNNPGNAPSAVPTEPEAQMEIPTVAEAVITESVVAEPDEACTEAKPAKPTYRIQF
ncbi:MAG TPA: Hpt domain-containing protein, partial [Nitrosomonas sp.]|nr:Hpt domain-containing protein [Nitrosomonas sp.]